MGLPSRKKFQLNFFEVACVGTVDAVGQWKVPNELSKTKDSLDYWLWLAKTAERGKISAIFFADSYGEQETYGGNSDAQFRGGSHVAKLEPTTVISAMATVTKSVGFGVTGSTSFIPPYMLARTWGSLDHLTKGRMAWNVVTSFAASSARVMGKSELLPHDERYLAAEEYMDVAYSLWEKSWEDGAQVWQVEPEMAYDPSKIHRIEYDGKYHKFSGVSQTHPSPQRTPVIFQAGASKSGIAFGGKHAEAIFCSHATTEKCKKYTTSVREAAKVAGRDPQAINFFLGAMPFIGRTIEEAQAKFDAAAARASVEGGLARISSFIDVDLSKYPPDKPFEFKGELKENSIHGVIDTLTIATQGKVSTPEDIGRWTGLGGSGPRFVGTPSMIADLMEKWVEEADIDGFNLLTVTHPDTWEDVVDLLVPELQRRGVYREDYPVPGGTLRENLYENPGHPHLADDHPGSKFKWNMPQNSTV